MDLLRDLYDKSISSHPIIERSGLLSKYGTRIVGGTLLEITYILDGVNRWQGGTIEIKNGKETNKDHVRGMLDIVLRYYNFFSYICNGTGDLVLSIIGHDLGEHGIGDISQTRQNAYELKKAQKLLEERMAYQILSQIKESRFSKDFLVIVNNYFNLSLNVEKLEDTNLVAFLTKILDYVQGFEYGLDNVFYDNIKTVGREPVLNHITRGLEIIDGLFNFLEKIIFTRNMGEFTLARLCKIKSEIISNISDKIRFKYGVILEIDRNNGVRVVLSKYGVSEAA